MSDYNLRQKIFLGLSFVSSVAFLLFSVYFVKKVVIDNGNVLGVSASIVDLNSQDEEAIDLTQKISISKPSTVSFNELDIISDLAELSYTENKPNVTNGRAIIHSGTQTELVFDKNEVVILEPGTIYINSSLKLIYVIKGKILVNHEYYLEDGQKFTIGALNPIEITGSDELNVDKVFESLVRIMFVEDKLPKELETYAPFPDFMEI